MADFKTKSIKSIIDPVVQQTENLVRIGDCIEKGLPMPNLEGNVVNILNSTKGFIAVLDRTFSQSEDGKLKFELKEFKEIVNESITLLENSLSMLKSGQKKEAAHYLVTGANGVISNVVQILMSYDDSQIRKIENHLTNLEDNLDKITEWSYECVSTLIDGIQRAAVSACHLLKPRTADLLCEDLASIISFLTLELEGFRIKFVEALNELFQASQQQELILYTEQCSTVKFQLYKTSVSLRQLIWLPRIKNGEMEAYAAVLPHIAKFSLHWVERHSLNPTNDTSGRFMAEYIVDQCEKFHKTSMTNLDLDEHDIRQSLYKFTGAFNRPPQVSKAKEVLEGINRIENRFISSYNEWVDSRSQETKISEIMSFDPSGCVDFRDWINTLRVMCENAHNACQLPPRTTVTNEAETLVGTLFEVLKRDNLQSDFEKRSMEYFKINSMFNDLMEKVKEIGCDKMFTSTHNAVESSKDFHLLIKNFQDGIIHKPEFLALLDNKCSIFDSDINSLQPITNYIMNTQPLPLGTVFRIQQSLESLNLHKNLINIMCDELKKSPDNEHLQKALLESINDANNEAKNIEEYIVENSDFGNVLDYIIKSVKGNLSEIKEEDQQKTKISKIEKHTIENLLEKLVKKLEAEKDNCQDPIRKKQLEDKLELLLNARDNLSKDINPYFVLNQISLQNEVMVPLENLNIEEKKVEAPKPYVVPEKFAEADKILQAPSSDDRIAVAASELHKQVNLETIKDSTIESNALNISYMFANMSNAFKTNSNPSDIIDIAKSISAGTLNIVDLVKDLLGRCKDQRLKQILSSANNKLPTICNQLKILSALTASRLKASQSPHGTKIQESNELLIECAENIMKCLKDVVKAAESARIKCEPTNSKVEPAQTQKYSDL